jgi:ATP-dependent DNA ligase
MRLSQTDGWRAVAGVLEEHRPVPYSRQGGDLGAICPEVLDEPRGLPIGTVLDGEPCAVVGDRLEFTALARRRGRGRRRWPPIVYLVFNCLAITGAALRARPLQECLDRLGELLRRGGFTSTAAVRAVGIDMCGTALEAMRGDAARPQPGVCPEVSCLRRRDASMP